MSAVVQELVKPKGLTPRWTQLRKHVVQSQLITSTARFRVVPAGRRSGKTERAKRFLIRQAITANNTPWDDPRFFAAAPTRDQAKNIYWEDLKRMVPQYLMARQPLESSLSIKLINGSEIRVVGMDKPQRMEGVPWDGGILDEYADMKSTAWGANIRPALADRSAWCWFIGVPEGRNHYYDLWRRALADEKGEWEGFTWISADILPASEVESAREDLDEMTFKQEFEASFINFMGMVYYSFSDVHNCRRLTYNPYDPLVFCFDFNVSPGIAVICQEQKLPNGLTGTGIIGEVWIPFSSNTEIVCNRLIKDWGDHQGTVEAYGDASGGNAGTAKLVGSDWDIIDRMMRKQYGKRYRNRVPEANPSIRARINSVNSRLKSANGNVHMMVDPYKAPHVVKDFEGVVLLVGGSGEIDKKKTPELTHMSDGVGYYIFKQFPVTRQDLHVKKLGGL